MGILRPELNLPGSKLALEVPRAGWCIKQEALAAVRGTLAPAPFVVFCTSYRAERFSLTAAGGTDHDADRADDRDDDHRRRQHCDDTRGGACVLSAHLRRPGGRVRANVTSPRARASARRHGSTTTAGVAVAEAAAWFFSLALTLLSPRAR